MPRRSFAPLVFGVALTWAATAPLFAQGVTGNRQGQGGSAVKGAAGPEQTTGANGLEKCDAPLAALAVAEPQDYVLTALHQYRLGSPTGLIRLMIQQSNCFIVVERGVGLQNALQERQLAAAGELREGSNVGGGQILTADFILTPAIVFSENNAAGVGAAVGGLFGGRAAAVSGGLKFKEAQTSMLVADARTTVQVAAAEGSTKKADIRVGSGVFGNVAGLGEGYGNTNEGKIVAAALLDNYNNIVKAIRSGPNAQYKFTFDPSLGTYTRSSALQRNVGTLAEEAAAGGEARAGAVFGEGDVLGPKIGGVQLMDSPADTAKVLKTLQRTDEVVVVGPSMAGYVNVQSATGSGWVKVVLMSKHK